MTAAVIMNGTCVTCGNASSHFDRQECECDAHPDGQDMSLWSKPEPKRPWRDLLRSEEGHNLV